jgi:hypothetical protein
MAMAIRQGYIDLPATSPYYRQRDIRHQRQIVSVSSSLARYMGKGILFRRTWKGFGFAHLGKSERRRHPKEQDRPEATSVV